MNVTHVVTSAIGIENIDSERSTRVVFGNRRSNTDGVQPCIQGAHSEPLIASAAMT